MKKKYIYIALAVVLLGAGAYFYFNKNGTEEVRYRKDLVSRGDITVQVRATGTINPVQKVLVGSQVSGTISRITVDFNSVVKKGEILAQIDSTFLSASVKEAEANVERNRAEVNQAKRVYDRTQELFKKNLSAQADLDAALTTYESTMAQFNQTQAALDRVRVNLRYSTIKSPIDGVVISRDVDVGQTVAASLQAPQLFSIANDLTRMQVEASVDEADIGQVKEGQTVTFTVDAYADESFNGTVKQVRLAPIVTQNVVTYTIIIDVPNPELKLRPGMTATVSILVDKREDVLRIPTLAIRFQPPASVLEKMNSAPSSSRPDQGQQQGQKKQTKQMSGSGERSGEGIPHSQGMKKNEMKMASIWYPDGKSGLKQFKVKLGLNDNRFVEILEGDTKEGDSVIVGIVADGANGAAGQTNPFGPRMPGGSGGRSGR